MIVDICDKMSELSSVVDDAEFVSFFPGIKSFWVQDSPWCTSNVEKQSVLTKNCYHSREEYLGHFLVHVSISERCGHSFDAFVRLCVWRYQVALSGANLSLSSFPCIGRNQFQFSFVPTQDCVA